MPKTKRKINKELLMQKRYWKKIKKRYPFLDPRNHWYTGKVLTKQERKNTCPMLAIGSGDIPEGWTRRFGYELCEELRKEFIRCGCLNTVYVVQAKEKFGSLRVYLSDIPDGCKADDIINKYSVLSETVCEMCGSTDAHMLNMGGWLCPMCRDCYNKLDDRIYPYDKFIIGQDRKASAEVQELRTHVKMRALNDILPRTKRKGRS